MTIRWFKQGRALNWAVSLVALGSGIGTTFLAPIEGTAITIFGWRAAYGIVALVVWGITALAIILIKNPPTSHLDQDSKSSSSHFGSFYSIKTWFFASLLISYAFGAGWARQDLTAHLVSYLDIQNLAYSAAVFSFSIVGVGSVCGRLLSGVLGDRMNDRILLSLYFLLQAVSISMLMTLPTLVSVYFSAFLFGVAWGGAVPQIPIILRKSYGTMHFGVIFGILSIGTGVGSVIGPVFGGYAYDLTRTYALPFLIDVLLSLFAAMLLIFGHKST